MTLLVTGATGSFGRLVIDKLIDRGAAPSEILGVGRNQDALRELAELGIRTATVDYDDEASVQAAFEAVTKVLLVSGSEIGKRVRQHRTVIEAAQAAGAELVYTSAPRADVSTLILAPEHRETEEFLIASGVPFTILRNNWYAENYTQAIDGALARGVIESSTGNGRVAIATRADLAEAAAAVLLSSTYTGHILELGGDVALSTPDMAKVISEATGSTVASVLLSSEEHRAKLVEFGLDAGTADFVVAIDTAISEGWLAGSDGTLSEVLGRATTPFADWVKSYVTNS